MISVFLYFQYNLKGKKNHTVCDIVNILCTTLKTLNFAITFPALEIGLNVLQCMNNLKLQSKTWNFQNLMVQIYF